jgi:hypothetical protein
MPNSTIILPELVSTLSNALQQHHKEFLAADIRG